MSWLRHEHGWAHRPWWKVAINTVLRLVQPRVRRKWVVYTRCEGGPQSRTAPPTVLGYGFGRIDHRSPA